MQNGSTAVNTANGSNNVVNNTNMQNRNLGNALAATLNTNNSTSNMQNNNASKNNVQNNFNNAINIMQNRNVDFTRMPVVDIVNSIILTGVNAGGSDIHMDPTDDGITVRIRVDGLLRDYFKLPMDIKQNVTTRIKIMAGMNITETRLPQDGAIKDKLNGKDLDLRVSSLPTKRGEKIVIRIMDYSMSLKGIEYLYFSEANYNKVLTKYKLG